MVRPRRQHVRAGQPSLLVGQKSLRGRQGEIAIEPAKHPNRCAFVHGKRFRLEVHPCLTHGFRPYPIGRPIAIEVFEANLHAGGHRRAVKSAHGQLRRIPKAVGVCPKRNHLERLSVFNHGGRWKHVERIVLRKGNARTRREKCGDELVFHGFNLGQNQQTLPSRLGRAHDPARPPFPPSPGVS